MIKKLLLFLFVSTILLNNAYSSLCIEEREEMDNFDRQIKELESQSKNVNSPKFYKDIGAARDGYRIAKRTYEDCIRKSKNNNSNLELYHNGIIAYDKKSYTQAIEYLEQYITQTQDEEAIEMLANVYSDYASVLYDQKDYKNSIIFYRKSLLNGKYDFYTLYNLASAYYSIGEYDYAHDFYAWAYENSTSQSSSELSLKYIKLSFEKSQQLKYTNDPSVKYQYYLKSININSAWKKVKNNKEVIVAVVDDGVNINHLDLKDNIWLKKDYKLGDNKVINTTGDGLVNYANGEHGTLVAGIIGAEQNNKIGIAGIAKNVKIMPIRVENHSGTITKEYIIEGIRQAIDNKADIINLSLGGSQFIYSNEYDEIIKEAYNNGIIVVISAGNGDIFTYESKGLNLDISPKSPVCNNGNTKAYSIGVHALDKSGDLTNWTNYGACAPIGAPGVDILSLSIPIYNEIGSDYNFSDGTSFSAPIVSGIVALGYNEYGKVHPDIVYTALLNSYNYDEIYGYKIDAAKYIEQLGLLTSKK